MKILRIGLTSSYCFRGFFGLVAILNWVKKHYAISDKKRLDNNLNQRYFLNENGFQFDIYTKDLFWSEKP